MPPLPVVVDDRDERLARHVAAEHDDVGLVVLAAVQELAPAGLGPVDIGGEEQPHGPPATSSGVVYQRLRSPMRARSLQPRDFGSRSMRSSSSPMRARIRDRSSSEKS